MSKEPSSTSQGFLKDYSDKIKEELRHFDWNRAFGPTIGKTREERVRYGEATGQSISDKIKGLVEKGKGSREGWWSGKE